MREREPQKPVETSKRLSNLLARTGNYLAYLAVITLLGGAAKELSTISKQKTLGK